MGLLDKIFKRGEASSEQEVPRALDLDARKSQLRELETACDALANAMREMDSRLDAPGWRERIGEYSRAAGTAAILAAGGFRREQLLDLSFEVRPVFTGAPPPGLEELAPLQDAAVAHAKALAEMLPFEQLTRE